MRHVSLGIAFAFALVSCGGELVPTAPVADTSVAPAGALNGDGQAGVNAAGRPVEWTFVEEVPGPDPCHTDIQTDVTITFVCRVSGHDDMNVATCKRTTTIEPSGYVGRGTASWVYNPGHTYNYRSTDILENAAGDRARVVQHVVIDLATGAVRLDEFSMTCLGK
jgi:hypothetical protein